MAIVIALPGFNDLGRSMTPNSFQKHISFTIYVHIVKK